MAKEFMLNSATQEISVEPDWKQFPETAPKDREIIVFGLWKGDQEIAGEIVHFPGGGHPAYTMCQWGSYRSWPLRKGELDDSAWMGSGIGGDITRQNIKWTHWMELPTPPKV